MSNFHRNAIGNLLEISNYSAISCVLEYLQYFPRNIWHEVEHFFFFVINTGGRITNFTNKFS